MRDSNVLNFAEPDVQPRSVHPDLGGLTGLDVIGQGPQPVLVGEAVVVPGRPLGFLGPCGPVGYVVRRAVPR